MLLEFPIIQEIIAEARQRRINSFLSARFGPVPEDIVARIATVRDEQKLDELVDLSAICADWNELRAKFPVPSPES